MTPEQLRRAVAQIENTELQARVLRRSLDYGKEQEPMKTKRHIGRMAVAAAAAVLVLSVTAFAAVRSQVAVRWSDAENTIVDLDEAQRAWQQVGSKLTLPEALYNGYTFAEARTTQQMMAEEQPPASEEGQDGIVYKFVGEQADAGVSCIYRKGDEEVTLDTNPLDDLLYDAETDACDVVELEGQTFYCAEGDTVSSTMVTVEEGTVVDSGMETQTGTYRSVSWQKDGVGYSLSQLDGSLTREELCQMALELCGQK